MNGVKLERNSSPINVQFADRDYFDHRKLQVPSRRNDISSHTIHSRDVVNSNIPVPSASPYYSPTLMTLPVAYVPTVYSFQVTQSEVSVPVVDASSHSHIPLSSRSIEFMLRVSGLPSTVTLFHLCTIFSPFSQILGIDLETTSTGQTCICTGSAVVRFFGPLHLRDSAIKHLNGSSIFPCEPPLSVTIL
jgi:hypothetical protein